MEVRPDPEATAPELDPVAEVDIAAIEAAALVPSISEIAEVEDTRGLLLSAHGVMKRFGGLVAVHDINFDIPEGDARTTLNLFANQANLQIAPLK